jgi:hypothetical protein
MKAGEDLGELAGAQDVEAGGDVTGLDIDAKEEPLERKVQRSGEVERLDEALALGSLKLAEVHHLTQVVDHGVEMAGQEMSSRVARRVALVRGGTGYIVKEHGEDNRRDHRLELVARREEVASLVVDLLPLEAHEMRASEQRGISPSPGRAKVAAASGATSVID